MTAIWAYSANVPGKTCRDARLLDDKGTYIQYPAGNARGQGGWDIGLPFAGLGDLAFKLAELSTKLKLKITRLAINVHGGPGEIDADGDGQFYDLTKLVNKKSSPLASINLLLEPGATILFMSCNLGAGEAGSIFLADLSKSVFPRKQIVGFTTIGSTMQQFRSGEACTEPGMRDSPYDHSSQYDPKEKAAREINNITLPWASEESAHAKVALNGEIIKNRDPVIPVPSNYDNLLGTWSVEIGDWTGYFVFSDPHKVFWSEKNSSPRHPGKWWSMAGSFSWSFDDDAYGWKRTFGVLTPIKSPLKGSITIGYRNSGLFTMYKQ